MDERLHYIAELLEQIRSLLSRDRVISESTFTDAGLNEVKVVNEPLAVRLTSATVQAELEQPIAVAQSGSWSVSIANQPVQVSFNLPTRKYALIDANSSGNTQIVAAVSGKRIRVVAYAVVASGTVNVRFRSGSSTNLTGVMRLVEAGGIAHAFEGGLFQTDVGEALNINLSANVQVGGYLVYEEI